MAKNKSELPPVVKDIKSEKQITYRRFDLSQRIEHVIFLLSFTILGLTGLAQKFVENSLSQSFILAMGGIENVRQIHHISAFVMMIVSVYHILELIYRVYVLRLEWSMVPVIEDFKHLYSDLQYYFGLRKHKAYYGRYNYAEKVEYLAVVWGTILMGITGFMMWNPLQTTKILPGEIIPAAKAAHGAEAILAVASILIWHFYHVHLRHFNKSMFNGKLTRAEMKHEHPAELAQIEAGLTPKRPPQQILRRRQMVFFPVALIISVISSFGIYFFVSAETTAITTVPQGETVQVFLPVTPTPRPTVPPTPTTVANAQAESNTWEGKYQALFDNRCGTCHGVTAVGGLSLSTYASALEGGESGPAIVPGDADASILVQVQSKGNHPGQLTIDELDDVIAWIEAGAPEK